MKKAFKLEGLDCANCAAKIERALNELPCITSATVNFMAQKMSLEFEREQMEEAIASATAIVKRIEPDVVVAKA